MAKLSHFFKLNRVIWLLTASDILSWGLFASITSLVGIYISKKLGYDAVEAVGIGVSISFLARGVAQIPIGLITDEIKKDHDDISLLVCGNLLMGFPFLFYSLIQSQFIFFVFQALFGFGAALNLVTWRKLFAKNLDINKEGFTYAVYDTLMSIAIATFSFLVGFISSLGQEYFDAVIMFIGIAIMSSSIMPALVFDVKNRKSEK